MRGMRGVTLIEVCIVMAIIAIMGIFMAPAIGEWVDNYRIKQSARDIVSILNIAKIKAISSRMEYRVMFNMEHETYQLQRNDGGWQDEDSAQKALRGVDISTATGSLSIPPRVEFNPDGTASSGSITIVNNQGKQYHIVIHRTGRVKIN